MGFYLSSDDLYTLVKSMTPAEKRYFRLHSRLYDGNKAYLKLFDLLEKQERFDDAALKQKMSRSSKTGNFSVLKKYLFERIIRSLKNYGAYRDPDSELNDLIETHKILEYKGMHRLSDRILVHAKKKAYEDDAFLRLCYILVRELINLAHSTCDYSMTSLHQLIEERKRILESIQNYSQIGDHLYIQRKMIRQVGKGRSRAWKQSLHENIRPLLRLESNQLLSRTAAGMYHMALSDYYLALDNPELALQYLSQYIQNQSFPKDTSKIEIQYLNEYSGYFSLSLRSKLFRDFEYRLEQFKNMISPRDTPIDVIIYERWLYFSITYLNLNGRFRQAAIQFAEQEDKYEKLKGRITKQSKVNIGYALAYTWFGNGDYKQALDNALKVIAEADPVLEIYVFARILTILIYYETNNWDGLETTTRSVYRHLLKNRRLFRSEKFFLAFLRQLPGIQSREHLLEQFSGLHKELNRLFQQNSMEADIEYYIHFRAWLKSKVEGTDFAVCVKEQVNEEVNPDNQVRRKISY